MASYLLLRNNRQIGPMPLEELINMGLKPYDLVWVEGKSAAWRYPGEISELEPYAPLVEEQPYDRFYRKPDTGDKKAETAMSITKAKPVATVKIIETDVADGVNSAEKVVAVPAETPECPLSVVNKTNITPKPVPSGRIVVYLPVNTVNELIPDIPEAEGVISASASLADMLPDNEIPMSNSPLGKETSMAVAADPEGISATAFVTPVQPVAQPEMPEKYSQAETPIPLHHEKYMDKPSDASVQLTASNTSDARIYTPDAFTEFTDRSDNGTDLHKIGYPAKKRSVVQQLLNNTAFAAGLLLFLIGGAITAILWTGSDSRPPQVANVEIATEKPAITPDAANGNAIENQVLENKPVGPDEPVTDKQAVESLSTTTSNQSVQRSLQAITGTVIKTDVHPNVAPGNATSQPRKIITENPVQQIAVASPQATLPKTINQQQQTTDQVEDSYVKKEAKPDEPGLNEPERASPVRNGARERTSRNESAAAAMKNLENHPDVVKARPGVSRYISQLKIKEPVYTKGAMGGLYNIRIPVKNESPVMMSMVVIDLQYIKANGEVLQTKKVTIENLAPGDQYVLKAPDSNRGIRLFGTVSMVSTSQGVAYVNKK